MGAVRLFNTLTRKKEVFRSITKGKGRMYSCGPTVYWYQHIGNMRTYIFSDILRRVLTYNGFQVTQVMNVTDVGHLTSDADEGEDKIEKAAQREGKKAEEIAAFYLKVFRADMQKSNIIEPNIWCKASEHIKEQIALIEKLEKRGFTYRTSDGIYFDSSRFKNYGKFARLNKQGLKAGKRIAVGEKKNPTDFALWKFSRKGEKRQQEWDSPWGIGFPGWHIECSAMAMKYLGGHFDLHTGGEDHIQIHHQNEIAQSESVTKKKFVNYWLHGAFLLDKTGEKVSKSQGGLYTLSDLEEKGYHPLHFRYLCLLTHYRKSLTFSFEHLDASKNAYEHLKRRVIALRQNHRENRNDKGSEFEKSFLAAINDDLNIPVALQVAWKVLDSSLSTDRKIQLMEKFDTIFGLNIPLMVEKEAIVSEEIRVLINEREKLRKQKMWDKADLLRKKIREKGYVLEDTPAGVRVVRV